MRKIAFILVVVMLFINLMSCELISGSMGQSGNSGNTPPESSDNQNNEPMEKPDEPGSSNEQDSTETPETPDTPDQPDEPKDDPTDGPTDDPVDDPVTPPSENINETLIRVAEVKGLNEQIMIRITESNNFSYKVFYKYEEDSEYTELDENLMVASSGKLNCYILGLKKGNYKIKIEADNGRTFASRTYEDLFVDAQDRSGYAHFGSDDGVGAYNNDGTVKDGTKIIYVTNENKNTVTCEIDGVEYVGLVNILQAQYKSNTPMLIRIIGRISTNQWNYKNVEPRLSDGSNATDDFFVNTFSNEYGENLANLIVKIKGNGGGAKTYNYRTTPEGLTDVRETNGGTKYTNYKGSDFPSLYGKSVFDDDSYYNMLEVKASKNITIEGVGTDAEFFQFGISFEECNNIEVKNITFTDYPEDALNFLGKDRAGLASYNRYWIHSCTFNRGYNAWDVSGERDKYAGDGSIDFNNVSNMTLAYNMFNNSKKSMLFGSGDSEACMNFTMHHNYFFKVESRLPLGRNVNIHSYNNYFDQCKNCSDIRQSSYLFSENNYFNSVSKPFINDKSAVKSYGDIFNNSSTNGATIVTDRATEVSINCKPDNKTNLSNFDINPDLFYYDSDNCVSDVSVMLDAHKVPEFVQKFAGAGAMLQIVIADYN